MQSKFDWFIWAFCGAWCLFPLALSAAVWNWRMRMAKRRAVLKTVKEVIDGRRITTVSFEVDDRTTPEPEPEEDND